jgi:hypothetical protein
MATIATPVTLDTSAAEFRLPATDGKTYALDDVAGDRMVADARVLLSEGVGFAAICLNDAASYPEDSFENMKGISRRLTISRFPIFATRPRQLRGRVGRFVHRTSSATTPTASSNTAAGSMRAAQLRSAWGRRESLSRPCARLQTPAWRRLIKRRQLAARSNGRTHKPRPCVAPHELPAGGAVEGTDIAVRTSCSATRSRSRI